jgi:hypothetical protein
MYIKINLGLAWIICNQIVACYSVVNVFLDRAIIYIPVAVGSVLVKGEYLINHVHVISFPRILLINARLKMQTVYMIWMNFESCMLGDQVLVLS